MSPSAALPLSSRNLPTSPSHYPPDSQEFYVGQLLEQQVKNGVLTPGQFMALKTLLKKQDETLFAAAAAYKENPQDSETFTATLLDLCNVMHWEANHQSILHSWIVPLEQEGRGSGLRDLWNNNDPRMMAAYQLYVHDHNKEDFIDTLVRLACVATTEAQNATADNGNSAHNDDIDESIGENDSLEVHEAASGALDELESAGRLSQDTKEQLDPDDPRVLAALEVYSDNQDVDDLVDTLERIASPKQEAEPEDPVDAAVMEKQILHLIYELGLPDDELAALKGAIVDNDVVVQAAIQVYEMEKDEEDFKDTLRRVARHLINANESTPVEAES